MRVAKKIEKFQRREKPADYKHFSSIEKIASDKVERTAIVRFLSREAAHAAVASDA
ncbi:MAG: hypothetical protein WD073_06900 [Xanthobacteraceae bacterium]